MAKKSRWLSTFWLELKRRKVVHVISVYASAAFVVIELVNNVTEPLNLPDNLSTIVIITLAIGFPISIILSWVFEVTPKGVERTKPKEKLEEEDWVKTPNSWKLATYVSIVVIVGLIVFNVVTRKNVTQDIPFYGKSIAVLPFINDSPEMENEYFINGTMEAILGELSKIKDLRVVSRMSVEQYRNAPKTITEVGQEMRVGYVLEGSGQKYGNKVRLTIQLIDAVNDVHIWSNPYIRNIEVDSIFSLMSEIAQLVAKEIEAIITPEEKQRIERVPTRSLSAWDFYQRGLEEFNGYHRNFNERQVLTKAKELYKLAIREDPSFAKAYSGLAAIYWEQNYWKEYLSENSLDSVRILADLALSYDPQLAEAYNLKGRYYQHKGKTAQALEEYNRAIEFNPNDWQAFLEKGNVVEDYAIKIDSYQQAIFRCRDTNLTRLLIYLWHTYLEMGFIDQAEKYMQETFQLDNDSTLYYGSLAWFEFIVGDYKEAADYLDNLLRLDPGYNLAYHEFYINSGQFEKAYSTYKMLLEQDADSPEIQIHNFHRIAYAFWEKGHFEEADHYFDEQLKYGEESIRLNREYARQKFAHYDMAGVYAFRGDKEKAYMLLNEVEAIDFVPFWQVVVMKNDPLFESLRGEPRYEQFIQNMDAKYNKEHDRISIILKEKGLL